MKMIVTISQIYLVKLMKTITSQWNKSAFNGNYIVYESKGDKGDKDKNL